MTHFSGSNSWVNMIIFLYESVQYLPERYGKPFMLIIWLISFKKSYKLSQKWQFFTFFQQILVSILTTKLVQINLIMPVLSRICGKPFPFHLFSFYLKENDKTWKKVLHWNHQKLLKWIILHEKCICMNISWKK